MTTTRTRLSRHGSPALSGSMVALLALAGSGASGVSGEAYGSSKPFTYLYSSENTSAESMLPEMAKNVCSAAEKIAPLELSTVPELNLDEKLQLLASQNALPEQYDAGNAPSLTQELYKSGHLMDLAPVLKKLGVANDILPSAASTIKNLYGGVLDTLPYQYAIEGFFYNKKIFAKDGITTTPKTWTALVADAAKIDAAGTIPFAASGQQGWPLTRLVSGYLYRDLGPDALQLVAEGKAKLTDPQYVKAAAAVAALGSKNYFGPGIGSITIDQANASFLTGKSAMYYDGTWFLADIDDASQDTVGSNNIGFMPFPAVTGGKGSIDQYPANVGLPTGINAKDNDAGTDAWLSCIAKNFGSDALQQQGAISGFKVNTPVKDEPAITQEIQRDISTTKTTVLWFEALFNDKATNISQVNAANLVTGAMSPKQFMQTVQSALG